MLGRCDNNYDMEGWSQSYDKYDSILFNHPALDNKHFSHCHNCVCRYERT